MPQRKQPRPPLQIVGKTEKDAETEAEHEAPWCKMPMDLICDDDITKSDLKVFGYLDYRAGKRGWFYGPIPDICAAVNLSDKMVRLAIEKLKTKQFISTKRMGREHHFWLKFSIAARKAKGDDLIDDPVFGNEVPNSEQEEGIVFGNQLPDVFGSLLPNSPVTDYRNTTDVSTTDTDTTDTPLLAASVANAPTPHRGKKATVKEPSDTPKKERPRNPFWDALVEGIGHPPPPSKQGAWGRAIADLKIMGATPEEIIVRCKIFRIRKPDIDLTASGLASCWYDVAPIALSNGGQTHGRSHHQLPTAPKPGSPAAWEQHQKGKDTAINRSVTGQESTTPPGSLDNRSGDQGQDDDELAELKRHGLV